MIMGCVADERGLSQELAITLLGGVPLDGRLAARRRP